MLAAEAEDDGSRSGSAREEGGGEDGKEVVLPGEGVEEAEGRLCAGEKHVRLRGNKTHSTLAEHGGEEHEKGLRFELLEEVDDCQRIPGRHLPFRRPRVPVGPRRLLGADRAQLKRQDLSRGGQSRVV
jgi:hypothetical protein